MEPIIILNPIVLVLAYIALMLFSGLIGGTVQVLNPTNNPKKKTKKKKSKKKGKKAKRTAKQKAASKRNIKKAQAARRKKGKKKKSKKRKKSKKKKTKKMKKRKKKTTRKKTTTTTTTKYNKGKKRKRRKKRRKNPKRRRKRKRNPKGFKKVKAKFPKMKGKLTVADGAGAVAGVVVGAGSSGLVKMATGKPFYGVAVHSGTWIGGTLIFKNVKAFGKEKARNSFARGWFVADGIAFSVDAGITIFKHFTDTPQSIMDLEDLKDAKWKDKIKTVFSTGLAHPQDMIKKIKSSLKGDDYGLDDGYHAQHDYGLYDETLSELIDELEGYDDLTDDEYAMIAEAEALNEDFTPVQSAASEEFV
jgi:hypothetical protein